jgi:DNA primase
MMNKNVERELRKLVNICKANLKNTDSALNYYNARSIEQYTIGNFELGYFPGNLNKLKKYIDVDLLISSGIIKYNGGSDFSDYYRIVIPIKNEIGNLVGIAGRLTMSTEERTYLKLPKYKNSIYKKSLYLYGMDVALKSIISNNEVFVVEGYFDQISMYKSGIENTVALGGTAFSRSHLLKLSRFCKKINFILDNDEAGINSARSIQKKYSKYGINMSFSLCSKEYKDVDEMIRNSNLSSSALKNKIYNNILLV